MYDKFGNFFLLVIIYHTREYIIDPFRGPIHRSILHVTQGTN